MSSRVANLIPRIGSLILGMSQSQRVKCRVSTVGTPILSIPNVGVAAIHTLLYVAMSGRIIALSTRSGRVSLTPHCTCRTRKSL
ncbi:hypothetical protein TNCV_4509271 [Trichonephila clavipes]|nr:hypothetical protein TNCV_4509271 [Trichonephila clavipes]